MSVYEFYRLKTLMEQVNTTEWSKENNDLSKTVMVGCCKLSLYANALAMSMQFIFGDD